MSASDMDDVGGHGDGRAEREGVEGREEREGRPGIAPDAAAAEDSAAEQPAVRDLAGDDLTAGDLRADDLAAADSPVADLAAGDPPSHDTQNTDELVAAYLTALELEAERLDETTRQELLDDVRSHIEVALAESEHPDRSEVTRILTALGEPREIVDAASPEVPATSVSFAVPPVPPVPVMPAQAWDPGPPYPLGGREIGAIVLLLLGAFLVGAGWLIGLWLLWTSPRWTTRAKLLGTFVLPGGFAPLALLAGTASSGTSCTTYDDGPAVCHTTGHSLSSSVALLVVALMVVLPIMTSFLLWRRARAVRPPAPVGGLLATGLATGIAVVLGVTMVGCGAFLVAAGGSSVKEGPVTPVPAESQIAPIPMPRT